QQAPDRLGRLRALLQPPADLLLVDLDEGRLQLRAVPADDLDELAVARRARVGGHDAIDRTLLRADARQPERHSHSVPPRLPLLSLATGLACRARARLARPSPCARHGAWPS